MKTLRWLADAYRDYVWPWAIMFPATGYGLAVHARSDWRYATWPCFAAAIFATSGTAWKLRAHRNAPKR